MEDEEKLPMLTLTFYLPANEQEARFALDGSKWWLVVWDMDQKLRERLKYGELSEEVDKEVDSLREFLHDTIAEHGLTLNQ